MKAVTWLSGSAPMKPSTGWPLTKAITAGIDWMPIWPGIAGCSSMFILTSLTLPLAALTTFSRTGVSCLHGPHHGAQKSISTGWRFDSSITSFTKVWVVVSLMRPSGAAAARRHRRSATSSCVPRLCPAIPDGSRWTSVPGINGPGRRQLQSGRAVRFGGLRRGPDRRPRRSAADGRSPPGTAPDRRGAIEVVMVLTSGWTVERSRAASARRRAPP